MVFSYLRIRTPVEEAMARIRGTFRGLDRRNGLGRGWWAKAPAHRARLALDPQNRLMRVRWAKENS